MPSFTVKKKVTSLADMKGLRVFGVPTAGKFLAQYGLIPVTVQIGRASCRERV